MVTETAEKRFAEREHKPDELDHACGVAFGLPTRPAMLLHHLLERSARRFPDKTALVCNGTRWTFAQLDRAADDTAALLSQCGLEPGQRAVVYLDNSVEAVLGIWGILKAGGILVVLNPLLKPGKLRFIMKNCDASVLMIDRRGLSKVSEAIKDSRDLRCIVLCDAAQQRQFREHLQASGPAGSEKVACLWRHIDSNGGRDAHPYRAHAIDTDLAALIYTSGTTGEPKGVMCTHGNMLAAIDSITTYLQNTPLDIVLNVLPLSFDYGLYQVLMAASFGGTLVLEKGMGYPFAFLERIRNEHVTGLPIVPTIAAILLQLEVLRQECFPSLRYITSTGDVLPVPHICKLHSLLPHVSLFSMYGLTECKRVSYLPPSEIDRRPSSVGIAIPNSEVFIVDEEGRRCAPGETGELVVRGAHVMQGYWKDPITTARVFRPGRYRSDVTLHSGDLFRVDTEGYLHFVGRGDGMLKVKEERISPWEIEGVILSVNGVAEAAVTAVNDHRQIKMLVAGVVLRPEALVTERDILMRCERELENYLVPGQIHILGFLPRTDNGKIDRKALSTEIALLGHPARPGQADYAACERP